MVGLENLAVTELEIAGILSTNAPTRNENGAVKSAVVKAEAGSNLLLEKTRLEAQEIVHQQREVLALAKKNGIASIKDLVAVLISHRTNSNWGKVDQKHLSNGEFKPFANAELINAFTTILTSEQELQIDGLHINSEVTSTEDVIKYSSAQLLDKAGKKVARVVVFSPFSRESNWSVDLRAFAESNGKQVGESGKLLVGKSTSKFNEVILEVPLNSTVHPDAQFQVVVMAESHDPSRDVNDRTRRIVIQSSEFERVRSPKRTRKAT